jgi:hypothetical protein
MLGKFVSDKFTSTSINILKIMHLCIYILTATYIYGKVATSLVHIIIVKIFYCV